MQGAWGAPSLLPGGPQGGDSDRIRQVEACFIAKRIQNIRQRPDHALLFGHEQDANHSDDRNGFTKRNATADGFIHQHEISGKFPGEDDGFSLASVDLKAQSIHLCPLFDRTTLQKVRQAGVKPQELSAHLRRNNYLAEESLQ